MTNKNNNGLFIQDQESLTEEINDLLYNKPKYKRVQEEIIKGVFEDE